LKRRLILLILIASSLFSASYYCLPSAASSAASAANNEILINEVELNPAGTDRGAEKVELYNPSSSAIDVKGWTISSTAGRSSAPVVINEGTTITTNSSLEAAVTPAIQPSQNLTIAFIDVGQGDSILVILPNTKTLLIDGGEREGSGKVLATLQKHGLSHIDVVVATHPHADHIGGLVDVIKNVDVGEVLDSGQVHTTQTFEDFLDAIDTKQIPLKPVRQGDSINLDPTVNIDVLNPPVNLLDGGADNEAAEFNDNSVVLKLTYGEFSALLTGDMEERNEVRLVSENTTLLDADVLKAGHHGSRTSSSLSFLNAVMPEVVIISLGAGNTYGHPHQEALDRILAAGVEHLFRTDIDGTITLTVNGSNSEYYSILTENNRRIITAVVVDDEDYYYDISDLRWQCCSQRW
jgi:beta-lactamase superfamily II metal-dependent hydrolase